MKSRNEFINSLFCLGSSQKCYEDKGKEAKIGTAQAFAEVYHVLHHCDNSIVRLICTMGSGKLQIWYTVVGDTDMDEIGVLNIRLYESSDNSNWTRVKTYSYVDYSSMLIEDDWAHSSYVSYNGTAGKYYKAYVCIWAGKNGSGDTRYMWTPVERAT